VIIKTLLQKYTRINFKTIQYIRLNEDYYPLRNDLSVCLSVCVCLSVALQPFVGPWPPFQFLDLFTQSVGLLGRGIRPPQGRYLHTGQHKHRINAYEHPCLKWDSNPRSQCLSGRRQFMPQTVRPL
jgi:hypothetical protein